MEGFTKGLQSFQQVFDIKTDLGRMIDAATSETLLSPDGGLNSRIRDSVNANAKEAAPDAVKCLRKRLKHKNPKVQLLSLTLTDYLVRHCGREIHEQIASKDFMTDMQSLVSGLQSMDVDMQVNKKVLQLIQGWGESFQAYRDDFPMYYETYASLKSQGIRFPDYDPSSSFTPNLRSTRPASAASAYAAGAAPAAEAGADWNLRRIKPRAPQQRPDGHGAPPGQPTWNPAAVPPPPHVYAPQPQSTSPPTFDHAKLRSDLDEVKMQSGLLTDALSAAEDSRDMTLISQLVRNCRVYQDRILVLMQQASEEPGVLEPLLAASEAVGSALTAYDSQAGPAQQQQHRSAASGRSDRPAGGRQGALVDFSAPSRRGGAAASEDEDDVWKLMGDRPDPGPTAGASGAAGGAAAGDDWGTDGWGDELAAFGDGGKGGAAARDAALAAAKPAPATISAPAKQQHTEEEDELALLGFGETLPPPRPAGATTATAAVASTADKPPTQLLD